MRTWDGKGVIIFSGDSVTDCGRLGDSRGLGNGYVAQLAASPRLSGARVLNRGVSGDRVRDLRGRWERDVLDDRPTAVSIMIGINDVWRRYDSGDPTPVEDFADDYRFLLESLRATGVATIICEPFLIPTAAGQERWHEDLEPKIAVIRDLAREFDAPLVPTHAALNARRRAGSTDLAPDGVHPSDAGHAAIAEVWLTHVLTEEGRTP